MNHREIFVKVNATVDEGIVPLVNALNSFERVVTLDSCQGDADNEAYVSFCLIDDWHELAEFVGRLSVAVGDHLDVCCGFALRLEWFTGGDEPMAHIRMAPKYIQPLATAIQAIAEDINNSQAPKKARLKKLPTA